MFEKMKKVWFEQGRTEGVKQGIRMATFTISEDKDGIKYLTKGDYERAKVAFNAKDTTIASLKEELKDAKQVRAELAKCHKELEQFYLKAIGDCRTVKQVEAVLKRYHESESFKAWALGVMKETFMVGLFTGNQITPKGSKVDQAAATKIKRINRRDAEEVCDMLDTQVDRNCYASSMAAVVEGVAGIEVDRTKILDAKDSGLDAWNVLLSLLSAYGIKHDDVL